MIIVGTLLVYSETKILKPVLGKSDLNPIKTV